MFFRNLPCQRWTRMVHAPHPIHDTGRPGQLQGGLLDIGYLRPPERARVWEVYKRAGKIDPLTLGMIDPMPHIAPFKSDSPWFQALKEIYPDE